MLIDWFTVGAQALNFAILVWLMKRFLYQPVLNAIDEREKRIAAELSDAATKKAEGKKDRDDFQHKNDEFDQQREALLNKATDEANTERQRLLDEARKAADDLSKKRHDALISESKTLNREISQRAQHEVFAIARKTLADLAAVSLEEQMCEVFISRLEKLDEKAKQSIAAALTKASDPPIVRSAFDLPAKERSAIQKALNETFSATITIQFETSPELVSGVELTTNGQKVAWSISDYLTSLETGVDKLLKEKDEVEPAAELKPKATPKKKTKPKSKPAAKREPKAKAQSEPKEPKLDPKSK